VGSAAWAATLAGTAGAQLPGSWIEPFEPFQLADSLYYVGTRGISAFLLTDPAGHVLIDTGLEENGPQVRANIEKLGFRVADIEILLSSHAHFDHVAGHADMRERSGATVMALGADAAALAAGEDRSALGGPGWKPVEVGRVLADGDEVQLGALRLVAHHTPGHTPGCTTWTTTVTLDGVPRRVVFVGGTSVNRGVQLRGNAKFPQIAEEYAHTFDVLRGLGPELFLAQHPQMFGLEQKRERQLAGETQSPFVDPEGFLAFVAAQEAAFRARLSEQELGER